MLKSMKIQNYRVFRRLEMDNLGAVNIVVGKNNTGENEPAGGDLFADRRERSIYYEFSHTSSS